MNLDSRVPPNRGEPEPARRSTNRPGGTFGVKFWTGAVGGLLVAAMVAAAVLVDRSTPIPVTRPNPTPVVLPVTRTTTDQVTAVSVKVVLDAPLQAVLRRTGILTEVRIAAGDRLENGHVLVEIDGRRIVAMISPRAPYRNLGIRDRGPDVRALQKWLGRLKFYRGAAKGRFDSATRAAVQRWQRSIGEKATGRFDLGSVIWVGTAPAAVAEVMFTTGRSVNAADTILTVSAGVRSISVAEPPGGIHQSGDQLLAVGDVAVPYAPGSGRVSDVRAARKIKAALGTTLEGLGRVRSKSPLAVKLIPASAVVNDSDGRTCVFGSADGPPVSIAPIGGGLGGVAVSEEMPLLEVLANPSLVRDDLTCA